MPREYFQSEYFHSWGRHFNWRQHPVHRSRPYEQHLGGGHHHHSDGIQRVRHPEELFAVNDVTSLTYATVSKMLSGIGDLTGLSALSRLQMPPKHTFTTHSKV